MIMTNADMDAKILFLQQFLDRRDCIGYAAARNTRLLSTTATEYINRKEELILKYGSEEFDKNGNKTGRKMLSTNDLNFKKYAVEIDLYANIEHEVDVFKIKYSDVVGILSGSEILELDWMLED